MDSLADRIRWVVQHRAPQEKGRPSQRALSIKAGLSPGHIGATLSRLSRDPTRDIERETLAALARAGEVSVEWLATGVGRPEPDARDECPRRTDAARLAREFGIHDAAIDSVLAEPVTAADRDRPTLYWTDLMRRRELDQLRQPTAAPAANTSTAPVRSHTRRRG